MKIAIPFAVDDSTTEPSSDSAITITTPNASSSPATTIRSGHQWPVSPVITIAREVDGEHVGDADAGRTEERARAAASSGRSAGRRAAAAGRARRRRETTPSVRNTASTTPRKSVANIASPIRNAPAKVRVSTFDVGRRRDVRRARGRRSGSRARRGRGRPPSAATTTANTLRRTASRKPYSTMTATELSRSHLRRPRGRSPRASR